MRKQQRVIIEQVKPQLDCGQFFIKRCLDDWVDLTAHIFADGHDLLRAVVLVKHEEQSNVLEEIPLRPIVNDEFEANFKLEKQGFYTYQIEAWIDHPLNWQSGITKKIDNNVYVKSELLEGVNYLEPLFHQDISQDERDFLDKAKTVFTDEDRYEEACELAKNDQLKTILQRYPTKANASYSKELKVYVDRKKAQFSTWYEFFPRSAAEESGKHGTFQDCKRLIPGISEMGFDVVYFPPIHPIGEKNRKGKNNSTEAEPTDSGVPWAIGSKHGGHKSIHPELGSEQDFLDLIEVIKENGMELAMDIAFQCAPDHPYLTEHPEWFKFRPDGSMQYAENPPKKYQDIVNFNFECDAVDELWEELVSIGMYWAEKGIRIFRVDNPHTKPYQFWGYFIDQIKKKYPDTLFLAEAFSRPKVMKELAKQGFSQSYTYFTWRPNKNDLEEYVNELTKTEMIEYFRPNFWPNTPDINPYQLQNNNEAQFIIRYILAATLSSNTGIYGPVYEQMISEAVPGKEEYLDSEKYEIKNWDWNHKNKLSYLIQRINQQRKLEPALQQTKNIEFCPIENDQMIAFIKWNDELTNELLIVVNLDPNYAQQANLHIPFERISLGADDAFQVQDLITQNTYNWKGNWNFVELHPGMPFHLFKIIH